MMSRNEASKLIEETTMSRVFVRRAYFTGADEPYEKLKRALRAEIDEDAWAALYSTKSMPFDVPERGKIAVKVINHCGDEVLKVFEIEDGTRR
jgi:adenine-specific DNA-methyltransferase